MTGVGAKRKTPNGPKRTHIDLVQDDRNGRIGHSRSAFSNAAIRLDPTSSTDEIVKEFW